MSRARVTSIVLIGMLCACKTRGACDRAEVEALVARLDSAAPHDRPDLLHEQLGQACELPIWAQRYLGHLAPVGTKLTRHDERSRPLTLDHDAFGRACAAGKQVFEVYVDLAWDQRAAYLYEHCELDRYGLGTLDDAIPLMVWALHHWLLEQGLPAEQARTLSRAALLSDRRAYAPAGTYDDRTLPGIADLERRDFGLEFVHVTTSAVYFKDRELASIVDGRIEELFLDPDGLFTPLILRLDVPYWYDDERGPAQLDIAADRSIPVKAILQLARTGAREGFQAFSVVVETAPFEHAPLVFELARPDVDEQLDSACVGTTPGSSVELVVRDSTSVAELAEQLAALWRQPCVGRVVLRPV